MNSNEKPSFLDRGTLIAFAIIMIFWFGWSRYMETKQPVKSATVEAPAANQAAQSPTPATAPAAENVPGAPTETVTIPESTTPFEDKAWSFNISSKGMGLQGINIRGFKGREGQPIVIGDMKDSAPFSTRLVAGGTAQGMPVDFQIERTGQNTFVGRASVNEVQIEKTIEIHSETYSIDTSIKVTGSPQASKGISTTLSDQILPKGPSSFLSATPDFQGWFVKHENTKTRTVLDPEKGGSLAQKNVSVASFNSHYFAQAIVDKSDLMPRFESDIKPQSQVAQGALIYEPVSPTEVFNVKYVGFAGPKSFDIMSKVDEQLTEVIDYGMFAVIAKPILWLLKYIYSVLGNWGWAIVALTILVRFLVLPFNVYSYKSMKVMQKIQPEMTRIRERYKDKPADQRMQMNQEIMELMKRSKANPLGGCLPMLLQLPVFFALYQVLGQSIELYQAPFMLWIHDLSVRDPFYVLPVLMGITMFVQQKMTPNTMDPQQAKILMWMPVIFSVFMISLPSGLTLYIFVSTLFGIIQQYIFTRDKTPVQTIKEAKA